MNEKILNFAKISTLAVLLAVGITQVSSWTAPTAVPPDGNVAAPINVGNATQTKAGNLTAGSLTSNGDIDVTGDNLINVSTPIAPADGVNKAYVDAQSAVNGSGGNGGGGDNDLVWGYTDKHYFFTATTYNGNLGGLSGADTKCNTDANAISGKTYHAVRPNDSVYNAPGVGLYNDKYGWVNSVLRVVPLYNTTIIFNKNYSGNGMHTKRGSIDSSIPNDTVVTVKDMWIRYKIASPSFWIVDGSISNTCNSWTSGSASSIYGSSGSFASSNYIGEITSIAPIPCNVTQNLLCVEN